MRSLMMTGENPAALAEQVAELLPRLRAL